MRVTIQTAGIVYPADIEGGYKKIADAGFEGVDFNMDVNMNKIRDAKEYPFARCQRNGGLVL